MQDAKHTVGVLVGEVCWSRPVVAFEKGSGLELARGGPLHDGVVDGRVRRDVGRERRGNALARETHFHRVVKLHV